MKEMYQKKSILMYFPLKLLVKFIMKYVFINIFIIQIKKIHKHIYQNHSQ